MRRTRHVWFVTFPGAEVLDVSGPWSVLGYANEVLEFQAYAARLATPLPGELRTRHGLALSGAQPLSRLGGRDMPETLVIAGGSPDTLVPPPESSGARWLRRHHRDIPRVVSICTGAFVLGEAGLLDGRRSTTHWMYTEQLQRRFPKTEVVDQDIFLREGRVWTSAGITAGIDLMLAVVEEDHGHAVAMAVAKGLVLFLRRSGRQSQFSQYLKRQEQEPARLRDLSAFILEHLDEPLTVEVLADAQHMSGRTLTRWCEQELGESPAALVRRLRLQEAQRLLEHTSLPMKAIAARTGMGDGSTLWRVFMRQLGVTPAEYRARFAARARRSPRRARD